MTVLAEARLAIDAPIDAVWRILTDVGRYGAWNPFVVRVDGTIDGLGSPLVLHVRWTDGSRGTQAGEVLTVFDPPAAEADGVRRATFAYEYTGPLATLNLVRATRTQRLEQAPGGPTVYTSHEPFTGWFAGFVPLARVRAGTDAMARALKGEAEDAPGAP